MTKLEIERLREVLIAIRDYGSETESGYPEEICYDEFAYNRIVDSYRDAARTALEEIYGETQCQD